MGQNAEFLRHHPLQGAEYVTPDHDVFGFVEDVPPEDKARARRLGARPIEEVVVEQHTWYASEGGR
jgi:hypothetical protein